MKESVVEMRNMNRLWTYNYFDRAMLRRYGLDYRRHIRYDPMTNAVLYVQRRSKVPEGMTGPGRFMLDEATIQWELALDSRRQVTIAYVVLVETYDPGQPQVINYLTARMTYDKLFHVPPLRGEDGNTFWTVDENFDPYTAGALPGNPVQAPPF